MSLTTLVGGSTSDSYVTLVEANAYIASRPDSKNWNDSDYLERERLLRQATIDIDVFKFKGTKLFQGGEGGGLGHSLQSSIYDVINSGYQRLQFPRNWQEYYSGNPDSGTTTTLVDASFSSANFTRDDDFFNYGAIYIVYGTNKGESREISDYTASTGTFTVGTAFSNAIDITSQYIIVSPLDKYVKFATIEQALYLSNNLELAELQQWKMAGITARRIGDVSIRFKDGSGSLDRVGSFMGSNAFKYIERFVNRSMDTGRG